MSAGTTIWRIVSLLVFLSFTNLSADERPPDPIKLVEQLGSPRFFEREAAHLESIFEVVDAITDVVGCLGEIRERMSRPPVCEKSDFLQSPHLYWFGCGRQATIPHINSLDNFLSNSSFYELSFHLG